MEPEPGQNICYSKKKFSCELSPLVWKSSTTLGMIAETPGGKVRTEKTAALSPSGDKGTAQRMPVIHCESPSTHRVIMGLVAEKQSLLRQSQKPSQGRGTTTEHWPFSTENGSLADMPFSLSGLVGFYQNKNPFLRM